jgi:hypothetical protein
MDYDLIYNPWTNDKGYWARWNGTNVGSRSNNNAQNLASFRSATGQELHGIAGQAVFANRAGKDFRLANGSPGIDGGVLITGFNDASSPWPRRGPAPDIGAYEFDSGASADNPPVLNNIGNKTGAVGQLLQFTVSATDPNNDPLTYSASNLPSGATFTPATRTFSWTPGAGQAGTYPNVSFQVSDGTLTDSESITITVTLANQPPVLSAIGNKSASVGQLLRFTISATDPNNDTLTYSAANLPPGATFTPATRTFVWTPGAGQAGTYPNVSFQVSDGTLTDSENITVSVSDQLSLPLHVEAGGDVYTDSSGKSWKRDQAYVAGSWGFYGEDHIIDRSAGKVINGTSDPRIYQTERYGLSGYRFDLPNGIYIVKLHFAETYLSGPGQRVFDVSIEGQLRMDNLDIFSEVGYSTSLVKEISAVSVQDGQLNIEFTPLVELPEINGIEISSAAVSNSPPSLNPIGDKSVSEGQLLSFIISATDPDGNTLAYSAANLPPEATFTPATRTFAWTPGAGQAGTYRNVSFQVSDGTLTDSETITITAANQPPVLNAIGNRSVNVGQLLQFTISATDPNNDTLTYSASNLPAGAAFTPATRTFSWTPGAGQMGTYPNISFQVSDGTLTDSETITITAANQPPVLNVIGNRSASLGQLLQFTISATDPNNDTLTYSASNLPSGATFTPATRTFSWTPGAGQAGTYPNVSFQVSDGTLTDSETISIIVNAVSDITPPQIGAVSSVIITATSADIRWTTNELSSSQVEYWASPIRTTDTDGAMVTNHLVHLAQLAPGTTYNYRVVSVDESGNVAVCEGGTFTTPGATFSVSGLAINPTRVYTGKKVTISILVSNSGYATGTYSVTFKVNNVVEASRTVTLTAGTSQQVTFTTVKYTPGYYMVNVNGLTGTFQVRTYRYRR